MTKGTISVGSDVDTREVLVFVSSDDYPTWRFALTAKSTLTLSVALLDCAAAHPNAPRIEVHFPGMPEKIAASPDRIRSLARTIAVAADRILDATQLEEDAA